MFIRRVLPRAAQKTSILYDVYTNNKATHETSNTIGRVLKCVSTEDINLNIAQKFRTSSDVTWAESHCKLGQISLPTWTRVHKAVSQHYELEQSNGREIWPAQRPATSNQEIKDNILFCSNLGCWNKRGNTQAIVDIESLF